MKTLTGVNIFKKQNGMNIVGQGGKIILFMLPSFIAALFVDSYFPRISALPESVRYLKPVGYFLLLPGLLLWGAAIVQLLTGFSKGKLVTTGAYGVVRNPIYSSVTFFILPAVALITSTWVYFVVSIFLYAGVMIFIGTEEQQLTQAFGKEYTDYLARVDRLVPFRNSGGHQVHTKLSAIVKALRLRYAIPFVFLLAAIFWWGIHPWVANWGSTTAERQAALPGDDLKPGRTGQSTQAITIDAPPAVIWQWLVQVGQDRAGFYTYTWLENLTGANIHNVDEIRPEWQHLAVGDGWRLLPPDYLGNVGKEAVMPVLMIDPGHALVIEMFGAYIIEPVDEHTSRLIVRGETGAASLLSTMIVDPVVFTMGKRMLLGLKARAEGRPEVPAALMAFAHLGWVADGITLAGLFVRQRRRRFWLALPVAAALPALLTSSDVQAALAAFLAVGITLLGFLVFGRSWWGPLIVIGPVVLLTLLLASEAYTAIGITFAVLLLAVLGATVIESDQNGRTTLRGA
jgi:protein-S-isoprenylcysteine O-methyltransferase Ste14